MALDERERQALQDALTTLAAVRMNIGTKMQENVNIAIKLRDENRELEQVYNRIADLLGKRKAES